MTVYITIYMGWRGVHHAKIAPQNTIYYDSWNHADIVDRSGAPSVVWRWAKTHPGKVRRSIHRGHAVFLQVHFQVHFHNFRYHFAPKSHHKTRFSTKITQQNIILQQNRTTEYDFQLQFHHFRLQFHHLQMQFSPFSSAFSYIWSIFYLLWMIIADFSTSFYYQKVIGDTPMWSLPPLVHVAIQSEFKFQQLSPQDIFFPTVRKSWENATFHVILGRNTLYNPAAESEPFARVGFCPPPYYREQSWAPSDFSMISGNVDGEVERAQDILRRAPGHSDAEWTCTEHSLACTTPGHSDAEWTCTEHPLACTRAFRRRVGVHRTFFSDFGTKSHLRTPYTTIPEITQKLVVVPVCPL